jgi:hypothetical protein
MVPDEASSGAVAMLNLYNYVLDSTTIKQNWDNLNSKVFGVNDHGKAATGARIFPNPACRAAVVDLTNFANDGPVEVTVTNVMGLQVYNQRTTSSASCTIDVAALDLPEGIYMVRVASDNRIYSQKLVVKR